MMTKVLTAVALIVTGVTLGGCPGPEATQTLVRTETHVVVPPDNLYRCPRVPSIKDIESATDEDIAKYLASLHTAKGVCSQSLKAIKAYVEKARAVYQQ